MLNTLVRDHVSRNKIHTWILRKTLFKSCDSTTILALSTEYKEHQVIISLAENKGVGQLLVLSSSRCSKTLSTIYHVLALKMRSRFQSTATKEAKWTNYCHFILCHHIFTPSGDIQVVIKEYRVVVYMSKSEPPGCTLFIAFFQNLGWDWIVPAASSVEPWKLWILHTFPTITKLGHKWPVIPLILHSRTRMHTAFRTLRWSDRQKKRHVLQVQLFSSSNKWA